MTRILIIEDDPAVSHMLELAFAVEDFETETIADGDVAEARLDGPPADAVILDLMVPHIDGIAILRQLRQRQAWSDTKVVVATALKGDEDVWRGWSAGADYYLVKPFDLVHLRDIVQRLLSGTPVV